MKFEKALSVSVSLQKISKKLSRSVKCKYDDLQNTETSYLIELIKC